MLIISILTVVWFVLHTVDCMCPLGSSGIHRFGPDCDFMCHCKNNEQCDDTTGECSSGCASFWYGPGCQYRDIAEGEFSRHSDNLDSPHQQYSNLANDGNSETCSFTAEVNTKKKNPFWRVSLPTTERISELMILTKAEKLDHFKRFTVYVENVTEDQRVDNEFIPLDRQECFSHAGDAPENETINVLCKTQIVGNQVRIQLDVLDSQLVLCNVKIKGGRNLAFGRNISQAEAKTTYPAYNAVDGRDQPGDWKECSYAGDLDNPWLKLDIGKNTLIWYIRVFGYIHKEVKENLHLQLEDDKRNSVEETIEMNEQTRSANISLNTVARYVNITKQGRLIRVRLQICEIYVFGDCLEDICGLDCSKTCHCKYTSIWDKISGICSSGCKEGWTGESCDQYNATSSQQSCGYCLEPTKCDLNTGECRTGCQEGYYPPDCNKVCVDGKYGKDCLLECGKGCKKKDCDKIDGNCKSVCKKGFTGSKCEQKCQSGKYGRNCKHNCSLNCHGGIDKCSRKNGTCVEGCKPGWMGKQCKNECDKGKDDKNCTKTCPDNCKDGSCNNVNGTCLNGCKPGYLGPKCDQKCDKGKYGQRCTKTCTDNCNDGSCNNVNGTCLNDCKPGYVGTKCDQTCTKGNYGSSCQQHCSQNCLGGNEKCDHVNGTCSDGCVAGWKGELCDTACPKGLYGSSCREHCSQNCLGGNKKCDHVDGTCSDGCVAGWKGERCDTECTKGNYGSSCQNNCSQNCLGGIEKCNHVDGTCSDGCAAGWKGEHCDRACPKGHYGSSCQQQCSQNCLGGNEKCDHVNGICSDGCVAGWKGERCDKVCREGWYGRNCTQECSKNCFGGYKNCNASNGSCSRGCMAGWKGTLCDGPCTKGNYGSSCREHCSKNCFGGNEKCDHVNGTCSDGCVAGWKGEHCDRVCDEGWYGKNCSHQCTKNCKGGYENCYHVDGTCSGGCVAGWIGESCNSVCEEGRYGKNCSQQCSENCLGGYKYCSGFNGTCSNGCMAGWKGTHCDGICDEGWYGRNCSQKCSKNCLGGYENCNASNGACSLGCTEGWKGTHCDGPCPKGLYGSSCRENCSQNCLGGNEKCDHVDGTCSDGCVAGWKGESCDTECATGQFGEDCAQNCSKHCEGGFEMCSSIDGTCLKGCKDGWIERNCDKECDDGFYGTNCTMECGYCKNTTSCDTVSGICVEGCAIGYKGSNCLQALQESAATLGTSTIGIVAGLCFLLLIAVITVAVIFKRRKPQIEEEIRKSSGHDQVQNITERSGAMGTREAASAHKETPGELIEYANAALRDASQTSKNAISISSLVEHVKGNSRHILDEFKALPFGMIHPSTIGMKPYNRGKNRYKDMLAYDHSRVILTKCHGEQGSDYINATFIKGYSKEKAYIAAQGPIETSIDDFWRMIWEKNVYTIVMLTNLVEEQKKKCLQYWPLEKSSIKYGDYIVCLVSEAIYAEFIIRNLTVSTEGKPPRNVCQFHFKAWPDKGLPRSPSSLLQFWRKVRRMSKQRPWLVHCSAGVGRTGTFIATDILFDQVKAESYVDVFTCVRDLRDQRTNMVQTKDQYKFLYVLMIECFILPSEPASLDNIQRMITDLKTVDSTSRKTKLLLQYEALNEDMSYLSTFDETEDRYSAARLADNRNKNRFSDIIPQNEFRPFLITNIPNCTNYINAVFMPSYCKINSFILTQIPLENTAIDCCRLVYEQEVNIIVTFEDAVNEKVGIYLPEKDSVTLGPFKVMRNGEEDKEFYKKRTYTMSFESEERAITELVYKAWPKGHIVPKNPLTMLNFIQEVESNKRASGNKPVLVQCLNGAEKSGLIAVLVNILERARLEEEVSIPQVIRQLRVRREQILPNFEQFQFCYDVLLYYVERETTYANM